MSFPKLGAEIWRDYATDGVPASGAHDVIKADMREWMGTVEVSQGALNYFDFVPSNLRSAIAAGTDTTTDQATYWQAFRDALDAADVPHGVIPQCTIYTSVCPNFAIAGLRLDTEGIPRIISTSANPGFRADATGMGVGTFGIYGLKVGSLMAGTTTGEKGIDIRYCHQSHFAPLFALGATGYGIYISFCVSSVFAPACSLSYLGEGGSFLATPNNGVYITAESGDLIGTASGWCTLINPIGEYVENGIVIDRANGTCLIGGVAESCTSIGLTISANALYTNIFGTDFEDNDDFDIHCSGFYGTFTGIKSSGIFQFWATAQHNVMSGGAVGDLAFDTNTTRNVVRDALVTGTVTDLGTDNRLPNSFNHSANTYFAWKATTPAVTARGTAGAFAATCNMYHYREGRTVHIRLRVTVSNAGTATGFKVPLPVDVNSANNRGAFLTGCNGSDVPRMMVGLGDFTAVYNITMAGAEEVVAGSYYYSGSYEASA